MYTGMNNVWLAGSYGSWQGEGARRKLTAVAQRVSVYGYIQISCLCLLSCKLIIGL